LKWNRFLFFFFFLQDREASRNSFLLKTTPIWSWF
jgi:hypothetical protein